MLNQLKCSKCAKEFSYLDSQTTSPFTASIGGVVKCSHCEAENRAIGTERRTDYRFKNVSKILRTYAASTPIHGGLLGVHNAFVSNMDRVLAFGRLPQLMEYHFVHFMPVYKFGKGITGIGVRESKKDVELEGRVVRIDPLAADKAIRYVSSDGACIALEGLLAAMLTGTWTAFETLAGDLWEEAVNIHPSGLAELKGATARISAKARGKYKNNPSQVNTESFDIPKKVPLKSIGEISNRTYQIGALMGTIIRQSTELRFDSLSRIRAAYSAAFSRRHSAIDAALSDVSLDRLGAVRNLIVHRGCIADKRFENQCKEIPIRPALKESQALVLRGDYVASLISPVIKKCEDLIDAVDDAIRHER